MRLVKWVLALIILVGVVLSFSPLVMKWHLQNRLQEAGYSVVIKRLGMDFIFGEISLAGVEIRSPAGETLNLFNAEAKVSLWALLRREFRIRNLDAKDVHIDLPILERLRQTLLSSSVDAALFAPNSQWQYHLGVIQAENVQLCGVEQEQCLYLERFSIARGGWKTGDSGWLYQQSQAFTLSKGFLRDQSSGNAIFYLGELRVATVAVTPELIHLEDIEFSNLHLVESAFMGEPVETPFQTQIGNLAISELELGGGDRNALRLGTIVADSFRQSLHKNAEGKLLFPQHFRTWFPELEHYIDRLSGTTLSLESFKLTGGMLAWFDKSVTPTALINLSKIQLGMGAFDTSMPANPTPLTLKANLGESGNLALDGAVHMGSNTPRYQLTGNVQGWDISNIAAYTESAVNARVQDAVVDFSIITRAENENLEVDSRWQITALKLDTTSSQGRALQDAFDTVKDHNQSVSFSLAYNGRLDAEKTSPTYFFGTSMAGLLRRMAADHAETRGTPAPTH